MVCDDPVTRIRGRELQRRRARLFQANPWCVPCADRGEHTKATIRGHLVSLEEGGTEDADNELGLCLDCYDARKDAEAKRGVPIPSLSSTFRKSVPPRDAAGHFRTRRRVVP
jgi:hypothetical protein